MSDLSDNPLMNVETTLRFAEFKPSQVVPAMTALIERAESKMAALEQKIEPGWDALMGALEEIWSPVWDAWGMVCHLNAVKNSDELRVAYEEVMPRVIQASLKSSQSRPVYEAMSALRASEEFDRLAPVRRRVLEKELQSAELSGVGLEGAAKERFNELSEALSKRSTDFSNHVLDATKAFELLITDPADTAGWPSTLRSMAAQSYRDAHPEQAGTAESGPWRVTLDGPSVRAFLQHSRNRAQRKEVYLAQITRASSGELDNRGLVDEILKLRAEKAALLGFKSYAELSLATKMAPDTEAVRRMSDELEAAARPVAETEFDELKAFAAQHGADEELRHWDLSFWVERLREERFSYTDEQVRPYFPLEQVLTGLFTLCNELFQVSFRDDTDSVQRWHPDVRYYRVSHADGEEISSFYLDPYSRPSEKRGGAWMNIGLQRKRMGESVRHPVIYLVCNGTPPVGDTPSLMSFNDVVTLFHEFGHGLHGMLTTVDEPSVAGTSGVEWDAVELPSQFLENWCYQRKTLAGMARHVQTGAPMPGELLDKILATRQFRAGSAMLDQLAYLNIDLTLYDGFDPDADGSPFAVQQRIFERMLVMPPHPRNCFLCAFSHIFAGGYAAGYFSYKWAEVLSADAFAAFEEVGLESGPAVAEVGMRFREAILSSGGSVHPMELFRTFRGREPKTDALLRHNGLR